MYDDLYKMQNDKPIKLSDKEKAKWLQAGGPIYRDGNIMNGEVLLIVTPELEQQWKEATDAESVKPIVPEVVSPRQLILALHKTGYITAEEAEAWAAGNAIPAFILNIIDKLSDEQRVEAKVTLLKMSEVERQNPLLGAAIASTGATQEEVDQFFILAAQI